MPGAAAVTLIVIEEAPPAIVMPVGTLTTVGALLDKAIANPPDGAGPLRVKVMTVESPTLIPVGAALMALNAIGATVKVALFLTPLRVAEMVTV